MLPAPGGLQEVDGINHLRGKLILVDVPFRASISITPSVKFHCFSRSRLSPTGGVPKTAS